MTIINFPAAKMPSLSPFRKKGEGRIYQSFGQAQVRLPIFINAAKRGGRTGRAIAASL